MSIKQEQQKAKKEEAAREREAEAAAAQEREAAKQAAKEKGGSAKKQVHCRDANPLLTHAVWTNGAGECNLPIKGASICYDCTSSTYLVQPVMTPPIEFAGASKGKGEGEGPRPSWGEAGSGGGPPGGGHQIAAAAARVLWRPPQNA